MPCCGVRAVAKESVLGTRFFAHGSEPTAGSCEWAVEGEEHERLKAAACLAAREAGFEPRTEVTGADGRWRADVVVEDREGHASLVVEIQTSRLPTDAFARKTEALLADLPRVLWLVGYQLTELPAANPRAAFVHLPRLRADGAREAAVREAVLGMLRGSLVWRGPNPVMAVRVPFRLVGYRDECPRCAGKCAHLPIALVMKSEAARGAAPEPCWLAALPRADAAAALERYAARTGAVVGRLSSGTGAMLCPTPGCAQQLPEPILPLRAAHLWPGRTADGETSIWITPRPDLPPRPTGDWGPPDPPPPAPWRGDAEPDEDAWRDTVSNARRVNQIVAPSRIGTGNHAEDLRDVAKQFAEARLRFFRRDVLTRTAGDEARADAWLAAPNPALGGNSPADLVSRSAANLEAATAAMEADLGK